MGPISSPYDRIGDSRYTAARRFWFNAVKGSVDDRPEILGSKSLVRISVIRIRHDGVGAGRRRKRTGRITVQSDGGRAYQDGQFTLFIIRIGTYRGISQGADILMVADHQTAAAGISILPNGNPCRQ